MPVTWAKSSVRFVIETEDCDLDGSIAMMAVTLILNNSMRVIVTGTE